jgi:hypothetical protein
VLVGPMRPDSGMCYVIAVRATLQAGMMQVGMCGLMLEQSIANPCRLVPGSDVRCRLGGWAEVHNRNGSDWGNLQRDNSVLSL